MKKLFALLTIWMLKTIAGWIIRLVASLLTRPKSPPARNQRPQAQANIIDGECRRLDEPNHC